MACLGYFIRRRGDDCAIVKVLPGGEEILETGLTLVEAETLYFVCIGEPMHEGAGPDIATDERRMGRRRARQLAFKFKS